LITAIESLGDSAAVAACLQQSQLFGYLQIHIQLSEFSSGQHRQDQLLA
jgi:hypothetical protein